MKRELRLHKSCNPDGRYYLDLSIYEDGECVGGTYLYEEDDLKEIIVSVKDFLEFQKDPNPNV